MRMPSRPPTTDRSERRDSGVVRIDLTWQEVERNPGVYDFKRFDAQLDALGTRPLFILDYANVNHDKGIPPHTEAGRGAFARFAAAAAAHFRGRGVL